MEPDKILRDYMNERKLGYGLLREFIRNENWEAALAQIEDDLISCHAKIAALGHFKHMIKNRQEASK